MHLPLTSLQNGETGVITATDCSSKGHQMCGHKAKKRWLKHAMIERCARRLNDLGLTPGTKVTVVKSAPFNGPLEVSVRGSRLAIGRGMAGRILVDVER
jgi:Fe2+ transport system protein FeoA